MTTVKYLWRGGGEQQVVDTYPEVLRIVAEKGGTYETVHDETLSSVEPYCMPNAAHATDRWKNYKY